MAEQRKRVWMDRAMNGVLILIIGYFLMLPSGPVRSGITTWADRVSERAALRAHWATLAETSSRLDTQTGHFAQVVAFVDYECTFCRRFHSDIQDLLGLEGPVSIAVRHFPLESLHPKARPAALAAICAEFQGRFREMNDLLYDDELWRDSDEGVWEEMARRAGVVDTEQFLRCREGPEAAKRLAEDERLAAELGIAGTPAFVQPGGVHVGYLTPTQLLSWVHGES